MVLACFGKRRALPLTHKATGFCVLKPRKRPPGSFSLPQRSTLPGELHCKPSWARKSQRTGLGPRADGQAAQGLRIFPKAPKHLQCRPRGTARINPYRLAGWPAANCSGCQRCNLNTCDHFLVPRREKGTALGLSTVLRLLAMLPGTLQRPDKPRQTTPVTSRLVKLMMPCEKVSWPMHCTWVEDLPH